MRALNSQRPQHLRFLFSLVLLLVFAFDGSRARSLRLEKRSVGRINLGEVKKLRVGENEGVSDDGFGKIEVRDEVEEKGRENGQDETEAVEKSGGKELKNIGGSEKKIEEIMEDVDGEEMDRASGKFGSVEGRVLVHEGMDEEIGDKIVDEVTLKKGEGDIVLGEKVEGGGIRRFDAGDEAEQEIVEEVNDQRGSQENEMDKATRGIPMEDKAEEIVAKTKMYVSNVEKPSRSIKDDYVAVVVNDTWMAKDDEAKSKNMEKGEKTEDSMKKYQDDSLEYEETKDDKTSSNVGKPSRSIKEDYVTVMVDDTWMAMEQPGSSGIKEMEENVGMKNIMTKDDEAKSKDVENGEKTEDSMKKYQDNSLEYEETKDEGTSSSRGQRYLVEGEGMTSGKSRIAYLNTEEEETQVGIQESIVDDQIKKLISIRDDALGSVNEKAGVSKTLDETDLSNFKKSIEIERASMGDGSDQRDRSKSSEVPMDVEELPNDFRPLKENGMASAPTVPSSIVESNAFVQRWKEQAMLLQAQIRNNTFLQRLREQATEVLPEMPKFTELELLEIIRNLSSTRNLDVEKDSYANIMNTSELTSNQLEIIKCAEQLVEEKQRQTFMSNVFDCIRGLSVLNCMRIFIWPVLADNIPSSISQHFPMLPIEVNVADWIQGNRERSRNIRSGDKIEERALSPETILSSILTDALESNPDSCIYAKLPSFIDPTNQTLASLLTPAQVNILQMAEKFLPESDRREYADSMFSCVRRFEYFSCLKYFTWPMVRQHFPGLPAFPDYQTWYPAITLYPEYPIVPFPNFSDDPGKLPEIVDADATRSKKPRPEALILHILRNTVAEFSTLPPSSPSFFVDSSNASIVTLIPPEQLTAMQMAERLLPLPLRPEFASKTFKCIQEFNYLSCVKYSMWPMVRQSFPSLPQFPDILGWIPELPDFLGFIPQLPDFPGLFGVPTATEPPSILLKKYDNSLKPSQSLESKIASILKKIQDTMENFPAISPVLIVERDLLSTMTQEQLNIVRIAESIVPPAARVGLVSRVLRCLQEENDFVNCTRYIIWPCVALYASALPNFPVEKEESVAVSAEEVADSTKYPQTDQINEKRSKPISTINDKLEQYVEGSDQKVSLNSAGPSDQLFVSSDPSVIDIDFSNSKIHLSEDNAPRIKTDQRIHPVITVTGTRFVPIFTELPESVILNILKSIQSSTLHVFPSAPLSASITTSDFSKLLNEQQENIVQITESLLPEEFRPIFVNRMLECVRENNFLVCSRDIIWPTLMEYFPRLPSFPNFGFLLNSSDRVNSTDDNLSESTPNTETSRISEIDVKTGHVGDAKVTITDTRFIPIFTELPEAVILNILRTVRTSVPDLSNPSLFPLTRTPEFINLLTEQQGNIVQVAESLLPESLRPVFVNRMLNCIRENSFLDCTRDVAWPTVAQFFPRLPNFPNFGGSQSLPRVRSESTHVIGAASKSGSEEKLDDTPIVPGTEISSILIKRFETTIETVLKEALPSNLNLPPRPSYLDMKNPSTIALITGQEADIIRISESVIPDTLRRAYVTRMLECIRRNSFLVCTQRVSWPTMKQFLPSLPGFPSFDDLISQIPFLSELPQFPPLPGFPQLPIGTVPGFINVTQRENVGTPADKVALAFSTSDGPGIKDPNDLPTGTIEPTDQEHVRSQIVPGIPVSTDEEFLPRQDLVPGEQLYLKVSDAHDAVPKTSESAAQPVDFLVDVEKEKIISPDMKRVSNEQSSEENAERQEKERSSIGRSSRRRRSIVDLFKSYSSSENIYDGNENIKDDPIKIDSPFPNITESDFLQLLVNVSKSKIQSAKNIPGGSKKYFVDTLNSTMRDHLNADQYEILKLVEDLNSETSRANFMSQVVRCVRSLSFIRCMGIFVWPIISSNLPSLPGLPSLGSLSPFGRAQETEIQGFFGMTSSEFETELLARKKSIESTLLSWYKTLLEEEFETDLGFVTVKGYGNGELGISFTGFRDGRVKKIKDNKNMPSILTVISDIMEDIFEQNEKTRNVKKERSMDETSGIDDEVEYQILGDPEEIDAQRSIDDDQLIAMFLEKIRANASNYNEGDVGQFLSLENAYEAFEVLFGAKLSARISDRLKNLNNDNFRSFMDRNTDEPVDEVKVITLESPEENFEEKLKVIPLETRLKYGLENNVAVQRPLEVEEKEEERRGFSNELKSTIMKEQKKDQFNQGRVKNTFKTFLDKYGILEKEQKNDDAETKNRNKVTSKIYTKEVSSVLSLHLPSLNEDVLTRKTTSSLIHLGRDLRAKMTQVMPGIGLVISFLVQMALAHARAAASMASMLSNMALGSAMFGMIRQAIFGPSTHPKIKYVYDNDKVGAGIAWPHGYGKNYEYHRK